MDGDYENLSDGCDVGDRDRGGRRVGLWVV